MRFTLLFPAGMVAGSPYLCGLFQGYKPLRLRIARDLCWPAIVAEYGSTQDLSAGVAV